MSQGLAQLLVPWPERRVLCDDHELLVIDKLPGIPVHGGDESLGDDLVGRLKARDAARGGEAYLGIHQRLDQDVSGLLFMNRNPVHNRELARAAESRSIRRQYLAVVSETDTLPEQGTLEHSLVAVKGAASRIVKHGGQRAITHFRVRARAGKRVLIELSLETGRKHQIRAQLAAIGAAVSGDALYGGERAPRLMLHCTGLYLPTFDRSFDSEPPRYLNEWFLHGMLRVPEEPAPDLEDAGCLRWRLAGKVSAFRLVNAAADLLPGVVVEVYREFATLSLSTREALERQSDLAKSLVTAGAAGVYAKLRVRTDLRRQAMAELAPPQAIAGRAAPMVLVVSEHSMKLGVELADGLSTGLFVDQRDNRARVRAVSRGLSVLNLFAYTCSFSVAAALGGAREVVSVDVSKRALERGKRNFELNGLDPRSHRFVADDAVKWLRRAAKRGLSYDLVILDPPSFSTRGKSTFSVAAGYPSLLGSVFEVLGTRARLLAVTNHQKTSEAQLRAMLLRAARARGRDIVTLKASKAGMDCRVAPQDENPTKSVWIEVR